MSADLLWGVLPYVTAVLFFTVPIVRMVFRPFSWTTRASSLFNKRSLGVASLMMHWGLLLVLLGHLSGLYGGLVGSGAAIAFFYWIALIGGVMVLLGSIVALARRVLSPEVRAMSQAEDYIVHLLLIPIVALALYQVIAHRIFGVAYTASAWVASLWTLNPQPELMDSASLITKWHVFLAMVFFTYFPFTKLVHFWTFPINYFVRPYQAMRTAHRRSKGAWEFALRSDKSWLTYGLALTLIGFLIAGSLLGRAAPPKTLTSASGAMLASSAGERGAIETGDLTGYVLYISQCARCHGLTGQGDGPGAESPTFAQPPRDLVEAQHRFISTANGVASDEDLARAIREGLEPAGMPGFDRLSEKQIDSLVRVLREMQAEPGPTPQPIRIPEPPASANLASGESLYQNNCASCHGQRGRGDGPLAQNFPIPTRDLTKPKEYKAGADPASLYQRIAAGVPPYMPPQRSNLNGDEIWAIVSYVRELQGRSSDLLADKGQSAP